MSELIEMLRSGRWAVVNRNKQILQTFDDLDEAWNAVEKIKGDFTVMDSNEILENMRIKDKDEYKMALDRMDELIRLGGISDNYELDNLATVIREYEDIHYPDEK